MTAEYRERHYEDVDKVKAEQISQLAHMADESYQAWERSKEASKLVRQKDNHNGVETTKEAREQDGDPRYLSETRKALEDIRKIVGADARIKIDARFSDLEKLSDEELQQRALEILNAGTTSDLHVSDIECGEDKE